MMDFTNLVDKVNIPALVTALRECVRADVDCHYCPYYNHDACIDDLKLDAVEAIEELENALADECKECDYLVNENTRLTTENKELQAQLPKRGEWVGVSPMVDTVQCSICGGQLFSAELETPYCPYCGAKMTEVQE